jgi:hypothetical protein
MKAVGYSMVLCLGHDDRAKEYQPVAEKFGPRFYDCQFAQTAEESWAECERIEREKSGEKADIVKESATSYYRKSGFADGEQMRLL